MEFTSIPLEGLDPKEGYRLITNLVVPRPIAFVSTQSAAGVRNLAPFSYFNLGGSNPLSVMFSPAGQPSGEPKDTLANILETKEYVINLVVRDMVAEMNKTSAGVPPHVDEWELSGLTALPSVVVAPPRVAESPVHLECKLFEVVSHGSGIGAANYVIGEVVHMHVDPYVLENLEAFGTVARLGGAAYLDSAALERFVIERPS